jgi:hypothetical protein
MPTSPPNSAEKVAQAKELVLGLRTLELLDDYRRGDIGRHLREEPQMPAAVSLLRCADDDPNEVR